MVYCAGAAAARAVGVASNAGATALGIGMGKTDLELTRDLFKMQMRQTKRLWTADWAENSYRHGESCTQSAQQHAEAQAMSAASYYQAEKLASQQIKLSRDQDSRSYEISWRSEVRESLRDELTNQNNRFNIIMLCDTVCLGCVFALVAEGVPPEDSSMAIVNSYVLFVALSIMLFTISLWCAVIVVRRLHEHTASKLERILFLQDDDLQSAWQHQLQMNLPTGPQILHLVDQAYEKWVDNYINPLGHCSIHMLSVGVVTMFFTAGILTHARYLLEFDAPTAVWIFWGTVIATSTAIIYLKYSEDFMERRKEGVYDNSWQDDNSKTEETGPFAKINKTAEELFSESAKDLGSTKRMESFSYLEKTEREYCSKTKSLHHRVQSLKEEASSRSKRRKQIIQLLTTAAEEFDALPEDLTAKLNKILLDTDENDRRTSSLVTSGSDEYLDTIASMRSDWSKLRRPPRKSMAIDPIDAQRTPVILNQIRKSLGDIKLTTMLRIQNLSEEVLRLKSGVQLKEGKYIDNLNAIDRLGDTICHHLYPTTEIPPRSEVIVVARCTGGWIPTSRIEGQIVYTNRDESWYFRINFSNGFVSNRRHCQVRASYVDKGSRIFDGSSDESSLRTTSEDKDEFDEEGLDSTRSSQHGQHQHHQHWQITKNEMDRKANNEIVISIDVEDRHGEYQPNMRRSRAFNRNQQQHLPTPTAPNIRNASSSSYSKR